MSSAYRMFAPFGATPCDHCDAGATCAEAGSHRSGVIPCPRAGDPVRGFRETEDGSIATAAANARKRRRGTIRPGPTQGVRPLRERLRESVAVRGIEQRHEEDAE